MAANTDNKNTGASGTPPAQSATVTTPPAGATQTRPATGAEGAIPPASGGNAKPPAAPPASNPPASEGEKRRVKCEALKGQSINIGNGTIARVDENGFFEVDAAQAKRLLSIPGHEEA